MNKQELRAMQMAKEALEMQIHEAGSIIHSKMAWDALTKALAQPPKVNEFGEELCEDEGCPHHGTIHYCSSRKPPQGETVPWGEVVLRKGEVTVSGYLYGQLPVGTKLYTTSPTAAQAARQMRNAAVDVAIAHAESSIEEEIAALRALPIIGEDK